MADRSSNLFIVIVEHVVSCFQYTLEAAVPTAYYSLFGSFSLCGRNRDDFFVSQLPISKIVYFIVCH